MKENSLCPACHQSHKKSIGEKNDFKIYRCHQCGTLFSVGKNSSNIFDYDEYYDESNLKVPDFVESRLTEIIQSFEKYRDNNRFLDVGCGAGTMIRSALKEGWEAEGIEVSSPAVDSLRKQGIKVFHGDLSIAKYPENSFDIVVAVEILEHIPNPLNMLEEINKVLRPGGLLWATTPHGKGISARVLGAAWTCVAPPEHLHLFSPKGIKALLKESKFKNFTVSTNGLNPYELLNKFRNIKHLNNNIENNKADTNSFNRVDSSYELNAAFSSTYSRLIVKRTLNKILDFSKMGDSLKIWAEK
jgi:2-polyprenyl-3-methyl-5-hydroxy-6-metoxy-1,4-benzoquinol methylase